MWGPFTPRQTTPATSFALRCMLPDRRTRLDRYQGPALKKNLEICAPGCAVPLSTGWGTVRFRLSPQMIAYVYTIFNTRNGKLYVGWTNNPQERWRKHRKNAGLRMPYFLYRAMAKEPEAFEFKVLATYASETEAMQAERYWVSYFRSNDDRFGYNMTEGGEGCVIRGRRSYWYGRPGPMLGKRQTPDSIRSRVETRMQNLRPLIEERKRQALEALKGPKQRGIIMALAKDWGVSHTQVRRFIKKHIPS